MVKQKNNSDGDILLRSDIQFIELEKHKLPLVNRFYKQFYKKGIASKDESVFILKDKEIICSAKLKSVDKQLLLTGVACTPELRGQGYASQLIKKILLTQKQPVYCFPYAHLQPFYSQLGFVNAQPQLTPESINRKFHGYSSNKKLLFMVYHPAA